MNPEENTTPETGAEAPVAEETAAPAADEAPVEAAPAEGGEEAAA